MEGQRQARGSVLGQEGCWAWLPRTLSTSDVRKGSVFRGGSCEFWGELGVPRGWREPVHFQKAHPQDRQSWRGGLLTRSSLPHGQRTRTSQLCPAKGLSATQRTPREPPAPRQRPASRSEALGSSPAKLSCSPCLCCSSSPGGRGSPAQGCREADQGWSGGS